MEYLNDTIAAPATPAGIGAVAIIRVSGKEAVKTVVRYFCPKKAFTIKKLRNQKRVFGYIKDNDTIVDEVLISIFSAPHSYTGEDIVEIYCHCNQYIINEILRLLLRHIRLAKPGEFTQRSFINGKMDLTRAEAVADLLNVKSELSHKAAVSQLEGSLHRRIITLLDELTAYRIKLELEIDFAEQGLESLDSELLKTKLQIFRKRLTALLKTGKEGLLIRNGIKVALTGMPNVGKSTLFNYLLEKERAIVTATPGTTRDYLEETVIISGMTVRLFDTAGIRETNAEIEKIGINRSYELIEKADIVIDINQAGDEQCFHSYLPEDKTISVINKSDLLSESDLDYLQKQGYITLSAKTGKGINILKEKIISFYQINEADIKDGILSNTRQIAAVERAVDSIDKAILSIYQNMGYEFTAFDLKEASEPLEEIVGKISSEDVLNKIFRDYCIGK